MTLKQHCHFSLHLLAVATLSSLPLNALAKADEAQIAKLGTTLTCSGAEKVGGDGVAPYSGKWTGTPPGVSSSPGIYGNPYANEQPSLVITKDNLAQHASKLPPGQVALFKKFPDYKINVYPSHRDFNIDADCKNSKANAANVELTDNGEGVANAVSGAPVFPFPKSGLEAIWNEKFSINVGGSGEFTILDQAAVQPSGSIAWGKEEGRLHYSETTPGTARNPDNPTAYFHYTTLLPERSKGEIVTGWDYGNFARNPRKAWQYQPGTRRVRELPEFGFDFPRGPGGLRTVDDDHLFNGTPKRYDWTYVGKKVMYVPANNYLHEDPNLKYADLLTPKFPNPKYFRWEPRRVHVVEAKLKQGMRHIYAKRVMFLDEDSWKIVAADYYDGRGQLWRTAIANFVYAYDVKTLSYRSAYYLDLNSGAYFADRLWQQSQPIKLLPVGVPPKVTDFGPNKIRSEGK